MLYCNVLPVGQGVPEGNVNEPPLTTQPDVHVLLLMVTLAGARKMLDTGGYAFTSIWSIPNSSLPQAGQSLVEIASLLPVPGILNVYLVK